MPAEHSRGAIPFYLVREPIKGCSEYGRATGGILRHRILGGAMRATIEEHKLFVSLAEYKLTAPGAGVHELHFCTEAVRSRKRFRSTVTSFRLQCFQKKEYISVDSRIRELFSHTEGGVFSPDFLKGKRVKRQSVDEEPAVFFRSLITT